MDTKSLHCKHPKKMKSSKDKHEVFVLPPDILKKLGISIGNINVNQVITTDAAPCTENINNEYTANVHESSCSQKSSENDSILETASLMKKSVFLSPTFVSTIANIIPGEVEIFSKNNTEDSIGVPDLLTKQNSVFLPEESIEEVINKVPETSNTQKTVCDIDEANLSSNITMENDDIDTSNNNHDNLPLPLDKIEMLMGDGNKYDHESFNKIDNSLDNILDANCSNTTDSFNFASSTDRDFTSVSFNDNVSEEPLPKAPKINIISEETIPLSKLRELKRSQFPNINNLTPITVKSIVETKIVNENSYPCIQNSVNQNHGVPLNNTEIFQSDLNIVVSDKSLNNNLKSVSNNKYGIQNITEPNTITSSVDRGNTDIATNKNNSNNIMENNQNLYDNMDKPLSSNKEIFEHELPDQNSNQCEDNNTSNVNTTDDDYHVKGHDITSENYAIVNGFIEHQDTIDIDGEKLVENYEYHNGQNNDSNESETENSEKSKSIADKDCEKPITTEEEAVIKEVHTTKQNKKQNSFLKFDQKLVKNSENCVDKNYNMNKSIEDNISDENNFLKNEESTSEHGELASILNATKKLSSNNTAIIKEDKVKEIAAYLKKFSHIYTDKKKTKKALNNDINKIEATNSNKNIIESKLSIQGVEKPGGKTIEGNKVFKTYTRRNVLKGSKLSTQKIDKIESYELIDATHDENDTINIQAPCERQEFCSCFDFGRLAYYDCDELYEHIHFWQHNTTKCELDLIFSIYSDETVANDDSRLEQDIEENVACNICWNLFSNEFSENEYNSEPGKACHVEEGLKAASSDDTLQVLDLYDKPHEKNGDTLNKGDDKIHLPSTSNSDVVLKSAAHDDMVDKEKHIHSNTVVVGQNIEDNDISTAITVADSNLISPDFSFLHAELKESKEGSNNKEQSHYQHKNFVNTAKKIPSKEVTLDSLKVINKNAQKRRLSGNAKITDEPSAKKNIKCGLCNNLFSKATWEDHVANQHHLIAWKEGGSINLDDSVLLNKLKQRLKTLGKLTCSICNLETKKCNRLIEHVKYCIKQKVLNTKEKFKRKSRIVEDEDVTCGVCLKSVESSCWLGHIGKSHDYLAWKQGQEALDLNDEAVVWQHLQNIIRLNGCLTCYKCGLNRSRVKLYLAHIKTCDGTGISVEKPPKSVDLNCSSDHVDGEDKQQAEETVKCGVCKQDVTIDNWIEHIAKEHKYLAWQDGDTPLVLDDEEDVWNHLQKIIRENGGLTCYKCGLVRKRVKLYLTHVEMCDSTTTNQCDNSTNNISLPTANTSTHEWFEAPAEDVDKKVIKCGVCSQDVAILDWIQHIGKEHEYLAWQDGSGPLNLEDELAVRAHLLDISKQAGGLICNKCEKRIKYPKTFLQHIKECTGVKPVSLDDSNLDNSRSSWIESLSRNKVKEESVTCGVCAATVETAVWLHHIETAHQYLAWVEGQSPLDVEDTAAVQSHLYDISKILGGLVCIKCGLKRKYVKSYMHHVDTCQGKLTTTDLPSTLMNRDIVECAICSESMEPKLWRDHAMKKHYNIAWVVGDIPIDINNPYAVETYLKEYSHHGNKLVCKVCSISRVSYVGFYAHIIVCGKTEEETEIYKSVCELCQNKYLKIYKSQHMTMHREKEYAMERRLQVAKEKEMLKKEEPEEVITSGRRKAAEKAKTVIEKYRDNFQDGSYRCSKCGFSSDVETDLSDHVCVENKWGDASDSDESVKLESCSDDDSDESDIDSNVSDEEQEAREQSHKKKRYSDANSKITRLPFTVNNISTYMKRSTEEFIEMYLTDDELFPHWHTCAYEEVPDSELVNYVPPIEHSCKFRLDETEDWKTFNRFEANRMKEMTVMFSGASIQCMRWAGSVSGECQFLGVGTHAAPDVPRYAWDLTRRGHGLIQIWDCGNLTASIPKFALGIAHDYGTVWAIDWCPSGVRDDPKILPGPDKMHRLGLLAAAFSNGSAYIFLVPYPSSITQKEKSFYKLTPVAELRLASNENRKSYQATAIKWSMQKGHSHVVVGYADGTTAFYDLNGDSPLLRTTENNITIFYPYHDERVLNSCIEDVDIYPSGAGAWSGRAGGVVCAGSAGGAAAGPLQSHVAAARVLFPPHWPAALLAGDDCLVNLSVNELEWWGGGRRLGGVREAAGCMWCGRVAAATPPLLRMMRLHPCFPDVHKLVIGKIQMIPLGSKRKRQNDELSMVVEPITYTDAVKKYGIEFTQVTTRDRNAQQKLAATPRDAYPERFPLSDVAAMQFCPVFKHHHKLALATHAGLVFIVNV